MAKCNECKTNAHKTLFDYRIEEEASGESECYKVYVIKDDGNKPSPTGFCLDCFNIIFRQELFFLTNSKKE